LEKNNVIPVDAKGQPFNPEWHEALSQVPSETVPANEVIEQFRRGWSLSGRLLRPAQVIVSSGKPDAQ
jgi:molecular chaperone GrpE